MSDSPPLPPAYPGALAARALRMAWLGAATALAFGAAARLLDPGAEVAAGLTLRVEDAQGHALLERAWPEAGLNALAARLPELPPEALPLRVALYGEWQLAQEPSGRGELWVKADASARVWLDGSEVLAREAGAASRGQRRALELNPGIHTLRLEVSLPDPASSFAKLQWAPAGQPPRDLDSAALFRHTPAATAVQRRSSARALSLAAAAAGLVSFGLVCLVASERRRREGRWPGWWFRAVLPLLLIALAGGLRFEAVVSQYWHVDAPEWVRAAARGIEQLRPAGPRWGPALEPYDGDPWGYLQAAREPRGFYDAHVREPVFVMTTTLWLRLVSGHDVAVNLASAGFSVLAVLATYLLGWRAFGPWVGFAAATLFAVERRVIALSVQGWRDDAFTCFALLCAAALVSLQARPGWPRALAAGVAGGLACLTRITSLSFLGPGLVWLALPWPHLDRSRLKSAAAAGLVALALLAPYLIACQLAFGDALYSINAHTRFYRARQGAEAATPMGWQQYLVSGGSPAATLDTLVVGLTHYPFANKWRHFDWLAPGLGSLLSASALVGMVLFVTTPSGRLLLVLLFSSLLPYAFTWEIPGGREWRFTLHAYPFYLLAAALAWSRAAQLLRRAPRQRLRESWRAVPPRRWVLRAVLLAAAAAATWVALAGLFYWRGVETLRRGQPMTVEAGLRDGFFFAGGWGWPSRVGLHRARRSRGGASLLALPLEAGRAYDLDLKLRAAASPDGQARSRAALYLDGARLSELDLSGAADGFVTRSLRLPGARVRAGRNRVEIRGADVLLWYFRVSPAGWSGESADPGSSQPALDVPAADEEAHAAPTGDTEPAVVGRGASRSTP